MTPINASKSLEEKLTAASGKPLLVHRDPNFAGHATIKIASDDAPAHLLRYKPEFESELPYLSAFQCGMALRSIQAKTVNRFEVASAPAMGQEVKQLIEEHLRKSGSDVPMSMVPQLCQQLGHGLGLQLRSMPIAIRVDEWLYRDYPALADLQRKSIERQLQEAMHALGPSVRAFAPQRIIDANVGMSCAFAKFWAATWNEPEVALPFTSAGYGKIGDELLGLVQSVDRSPDGDRELVNQWAERLGLAGSKRSTNNRNHGSMSQEYSFSLPYDAFDLDLIGLSQSDISGSDFTTKVSEFFAFEFAKFGGRARVICNDSTQTIDVKWTKERGFKEPRDRALEMLQSGKIAEAIPLLWTLYQEHPNDADALYNLGIAYSELGQIPKAIAILERLIELAPKHVHGLIGLGVAYIRSQKLQFGEDHLRKALKLEPNNQWALKNLGACLLKQGKADEAVPVLEAAVKAAPRDLQSIIGLGQALEEVDRTEDADDQYVKAIQIGGPPQLIDLAKERRTAIAHKTMRDRGKFRPDVMMYITGALDKFANMTSKEVQAIGVEIAILGQNGLDINNPDKKYSL